MSTSQTAGTSLSIRHSRRLRGPGRVRHCRVPNAADPETATDGPWGQAQSLQPHPTSPGTDLTDEVEATLPLSDGVDQSPRGSTARCEVCVTPAVLGSGLRTPEAAHISASKGVAPRGPRGKPEPKHPPSALCEDLSADQDDGDTPKCAPAAKQPSHHNSTWEGIPSLARRRRLSPHTITHPISLYAFAVRKLTRNPAPSYNILMGLLGQLCILRLHEASRHSFSYPPFCT